MGMSRNDLGESVASVCVGLSNVSKAEGEEVIYWTLRNRDGLILLGIKSEGRRSVGGGTQRQN